MSNRLELQVKKTGSEANNPKFTQPAVPGRLASLRDNTARFTNYTTPKGEVLKIPVTVQPNQPHTSKGQKRRREDKKGQPVVSWSSLERKRKGAQFPLSK